MPTTDEEWTALEIEIKDRRPTEESSAIEDSIAYEMSLLAESSELEQRLSAMKTEWTALSEGGPGVGDSVQRTAQLKAQAQALLETLRTDAQENEGSRAELTADLNRLNLGPYHSDQSAACALVIRSAQAEAERFGKALQEGVASCHACINFCVAALAQESAEA